MNTQKRTVIAVSAASIIVLAFAVSHKGSQPASQWFKEFSAINYVMGKVTGQDVGFSIDGRDIDYRLTSLNKAPAKNTSKTTVDAKKVESAKDSNKKNSAENKVFQPELQAKKVLAAKPALNAFKTLAGSKQAPAKNEATRNENPAATFNSMNVNGASSPVVNTEQAEQGPKKTLEQWKSELYAEQNKEFIVKLVTAYKNGEISNENYDALTTELLSSNDVKFNSLGLYALRATPSLNSFSKLVYLQDTVDTSLKAYVQESLLSYHQPQLRSVLQSAIISKDSTISKKSLDILNIGLGYISTGNISALFGPRQIRDISTLSYTTADYKNFLPVLNQVAQSGDASVKALVSQILALIASQSSAIASN